MKDLIADIKQGFYVTDKDVLVDSSGLACGFRVELNSDKGAPLSFLKFPAKDA